MERGRWEGKVRRVERGRVVVELRGIERGRREDGRVGSVGWVGVFGPPWFWGRERQLGIRARARFRFPSGNVVGRERSPRREVLSSFGVAQEGHLLQEGFEMGDLRENQLRGSEGGEKDRLELART